MLDIMTKVTKQKMIFRKDLRANRDTLYLFGDNLERVGLAGQAGQMRGEINAVGIPTKKKPTMEEDAFFTDADLFEFAQMIDDNFVEVFAHVHHGGSVVVPEDGLGTGLSQLPQRAPACYQYLERKLEFLEKIGA